MAKNERLKRRLLQEAIDENILLIRGERRRRKAARRRLTVTRLGLATLVATALLVSTLALANGRWPTQLASLGTIPIAAGVATGAERLETAEPATTPPASPEASLDSARYEAPRAIDPKVFPLEIRRIVLDPGHGGSSSGTLTPTGLMEKNLALDIALRLRDQLREGGYDVLMTREDDRDVSLEERVALANENGGDLFVSIHLNWIATRDVRGIETYYLGPTDDPYLNELARSENLGSGYSLTDFRRLLEGIYVGVRGDDSLKLAQSVQGALHRSLRKVNPKLQNRGVKTAPFVVLIGTQMPAILAEVSCLSNREEADRLSRPRYRQYIADALASGIRGFSDTRNQVAEKGNDS